MEDSILSTIKKALGLEPTYRPFDSEIVMHLNAFLRTVNQFGIGDSSLVVEEHGGQTWTDFLGEDETAFSMVKSYLTLRVRMVFDPPTSSTVMQAMKETAAEMEWRLIELGDAKKLEAV